MNDTVIVLATLTNSFAIYILRQLGLDALRIVRPLNDCRKLART
jgi:hypothetical protein